MRKTSCITKYIICFVQEVDVESIKAPQVRTLLQYFKRPGAQEHISEPVQPVRVTKTNRKKHCPPPTTRRISWGRPKKGLEKQNKVLALRKHVARTGELGTHAEIAQSRKQWSDKVCILFLLVLL